MNKKTFWKLLTCTAPNVYYSDATTTRERWYWFNKFQHRVYITERASAPISDIDFQFWVIWAAQARGVSGGWAGWAIHVLAKARPKFLHKVSPNVRWAHTISVIPDSKYEKMKNERLRIYFIFIILLIVMIILVKLFGKFKQD